MGRRRRTRRGSSNWWTSSSGGMTHWLAVALIAGMGLATLGVFLMSPARSGGEVAAGYTPRPVSSYAMPTPTSTPRPVLAVLGDSFSPAEGQPLADYNWASIVAKKQRWELLPFGRGGTGYTNPGQADEGDDVFSTRVPAIIAANPAVVIVQGSTNDGDYSRTREAASSVFQDLKAGLPDARIVAVGPLATATLEERVVTPARDAVRDAAAEHGITFIDPLEQGWLGRDPSLFVDGVHPTGDGQRLIAEAFLAALPAE